MNTTVNHQKKCIPAPDRFEWSEEYLIGESTIDRQHEELFGIFFKIRRALETGEGYKIIESVLIELRAYTLEHLTYEEQFIKKLSLESQQEHLQEHETFVEKLDNLISDFSESQPVLTLEVIYFIQKWLIHHVLVSDLSLKEYFSRKTSQS